MDFTGTFTRTINDGRTFVANGTWNGTGSIKATWIDADISQIPDCSVDVNNSDNISMPVNNTSCLMDDSGDLPVYMIDGEYEADGRFTSSDVTVLSQEHEISTFEGIGSFEGTGTFNGTGLFTGIGEFSGDMVAPGSFYQTGLVPGDYEVYATFDNGREVLLPELISVGLVPSYDLSLSIPGSVLRGNITDLAGNNITNYSFELTDLLLDNSSPIQIDTNSTGGYYYGPISSGEYQYRIDIDSDGFYELNDTISIGSEAGSFEPISVIPDMFDVSIQLISPLNSSTSESLFSVDNRTIEISSSDSTDTLTFTTDENGIFDAELIPGSYQLSDSNSTDYVLFNSFKLEEDMNISAHYSVATVVTGTMKVCTAPILSDCESGNSNATTSPTSNVEILFTSTSNDLEFTTFTNLDGEYQITLPRILNSS